MTRMMITKQEFKSMLMQELPEILQQDASVRESIWSMLVPYFAPRQETESRFDHMLGELQRMREESERKWNEAREESERKWNEAREESERKWNEAREESERKWNEAREESERKWQEFREEMRQMREEMSQLREESERKWQEFREEMRQMREESERKWNEAREESERKWNEAREESERKWQEFRKEMQRERQENRNELQRAIDAQNRRLDSKLGAIGVRWGRDSEAAFRNALRGILQDVTNIQVHHVTEYDDEGIVFGEPDQVELDVVIHNGQTIICELKAYVSKPDVAAFERKVTFYENLHQCKVDQKVIISPLLDPYCEKLIAKLGMVVYTYAEDVSF